LNEDQSHPGPYFARLPSIDLRNCVTFLSRKSIPSTEDGIDGELDNLLSFEHSQNFKDAVGMKPFWRLTILTMPHSQQFTAVWVVHHALADGASGLIFHRSFLSALQSTASSIAEVDSIVPSPKNALLPSIEDLHPLPLSVGFLMKGQWNEWFPPSFAGLWTGGIVTAPSSSPGKTHIKTLILSHSRTSALVALSRKNKTTVTAVLDVVIASALLANLGPEFDSVKGGGPISLRPAIKKMNLVPDVDIDQALGVYVSQYGYTHSRLPSSSSHSALASFSWDEARAVRYTIVQEVAKNGSNSMVGLLRWVSDLQSFFTKRIGLPRGDSFEISNVGVFKTKEGDEKQDWKIGRMVFSQCGAVAGLVFGVSVVTGGDGCAVMAFSWSDGVVDAGLMGKVIEGVEKGVAELLRGEA
jgi:hypothetical protein